MAKYKSIEDVPEDVYIEAILNEAKDLDEEEE